MITSRRDYILRLIDEVSRLLARVVFKRGSGEPAEALRTVVQACERLFAMEADKLFQFTPDQHFLMLTEAEPPQVARDKVLLYAALNVEAGHIYTLLGNRAMARASFVNALRLTLRARTEFAADALPDFAPNIAELSNTLAGQPLDADVEELLRKLKVNP